MKKYIATIVTVLIISVLSLFTFPSPFNNPDTSKKEVNEHTLKASATIFKEFHSSITMGAIGDVLIHRPVYQDAKIKDGVYDFKPMLRNVKDVLSKPNFTIANQESMIGGTEIGLSSYPTFNSPFEVADALKDAGVDLVTIANNHTLDRGEKAIYNAISHYEKIGMHYVGGHKSYEDRETLRIINVNGIKLGFLSYTYGTNGIPVPKDKPYFVNLIDRQKMKEDISKMKGKVDVIVANMHWGLEYQPFPSNEQKELARFLANEGVHVIVGHHPHVLQPMDWIENDKGEKSIVIYSLGNFLSAQVGNGKDIGGIFQLEIEKKYDGEKTIITLRNPQLIPTYVSSQNMRNYEIHLLKEINQTKYKEVLQHMNQWLDKKESTFIH